MDTILHIGQPKTGTTTLHHAFFRNHDRLRAAGVLYPRLVADWRQHSVLIPHLVGRPHVPGDTVFRDRWPGEGVMGKSRALWARLEAQLDATHPARVILSGEGFFTLHRPEDLVALSHRLTAVLPKVTVVAYLRDPARLYASAYQQRLKMGAPAPGKLSRSPYRPTLEAYRRHGPGPLDVHAFARATLRNEDIVADFTARYCPEVSLPHQRDMNPGLSPEVVIWLARKRRDWPAELDRQAWWDLVNSARRVDRRFGTAAPVRLTEPAAELVRAHTEGLDWLAGEFGVDFTDGQPRRRPGLAVGAAERMRSLPPERLFRHDPARLAALDSRMSALAKGRSPRWRKAALGLARRLRLTA